MRRINQSTQVAELPRTGLLRLSQFVGRGKALPIAPSQWWEGVRSGIYPAPVKLGPKTTAWHAAKIHHLIEHGVDEAALLNRLGKRSKVAKVPTINVSAQKGAV